MELKSLSILGALALITLLPIPAFSQIASPIITTTISFPSGTTYASGTSSAATVTIANTLAASKVAAVIGISETFTAPGASTPTTANSTVPFTPAINDLATAITVQISIPTTVTLGTLPAGATFSATTNLLTITLASLDGGATSAYAVPVTFH